MTQRGAIYIAPSPYTSKTCNNTWPALQVLAGALSPKEAVYEIMNLPQIEEH